jgi:predicted nicotinamide N-methyase
VLSSYLASISPVAPPGDLQNSLPKLPLLKHTLSLSNLNVIELGAGSGIVGITLSCFYPNATQVLLTDLPEASELLTHNISLLPSPHSARITHSILDWSSPLPPRVSDTSWDLVLVADCTYNPDVVPDLVSTLRSLALGGKRGVVILLAMKVRHEDEMVCFDLLAQSGFVVRENVALPLPMSAGEPEQIEIFVLSLRGAQDSIP